MRIALCLFGQVRDLEKGYEEYKYNILNKYNVDVYAHLWDSDQNENFIKLYSPKIYKIEKQIHFDTTFYPKAYGIELCHKEEAYNRTFNSISQFYSFYNSIDQMNQSLINYDLCIKGRTDVWFKEFNINLDELDLDKYNVPGYPHGYLYNDVIAFSSPKIMNLVSQKYLLLDNWYKNEYYNFIPEGTTVKLLNENNIEINRLNNVSCDVYRVKVI